MRRYLPVSCLLIASMMLSGCVSTVATVVTAPVKAVAKVADWSTTSQAEADRNRGRAIREREERLGELARKRDKAMKLCAAGDTKSCADVQQITAAMDAEMARQL